jgi:tRNA-Thr(GGU) m(6)t(6)A37 methyltransferase TsaA
MKIDPIGVVRNAVPNETDEEWGSVVSEIVLHPELAGGLQGLESFSHVVVVYLMHTAQFDLQKHLVRRPRNRSDMPLLGMFAQRSCHRPNPIGVTTVLIENIQNGTLTVRGLDAIDGSPVLDIKPHLRIFDAPTGNIEPEWTERLMTNYFS